MSNIISALVVDIYNAAASHLTTLNIVNQCPTHPYQNSILFLQEASGVILWAYPLNTVLCMQVVLRLALLQVA
jgi:hypothetical protein